MAGRCNRRGPHLDQDAAEHELLEKMLVKMPRVPRRVFEMLHAEPGQKGWNAAWRLRQAVDRLRKAGAQPESPRQSTRVAIPARQWAAPEELLLWSCRHPSPKREGRVTKATATGSSASVSCQ